MEINECLFARRSIRQFDNSKIPTDEIITEIINSGIQAPSACNLQAWKFIVIKEQKAKLFLENNVASNAPICILVLYRNDIKTSGRKYYDYVQSAAAAVENMSLYIHSIGLASCWLCHLPSQEKIRKFYNIPSNYSTICCLALGYPNQCEQNSTEQIFFHYNDKNEYIQHKRKYSINQVLCYEKFYSVFSDSNSVNYSEKKLFKKIKNIFIREKSEKLVPQKHLNYFCIHIVGECNLKCKYCDHFSPLAKGEYLSLVDFENDFKQLSKITNANINSIGLMGGEPLLHPNIEDFFPIARKYFPSSEIKLVTNGILLLKQKESFWQSLQKNSILLACTKYPINTDYKKIIEMASSYNVKFEFYNKSSEYKQFHKILLDIKGKQNKYESFTSCLHSNNLCFLKQGKLYTCTIAPNIYRFNQYFNKKIPISKRNWIDIYKVKNEKELLKFLAKPIPLCKYCDVKNRKNNISWSISKKDISEWTDM